MVLGSWSDCDKREFFFEGQRRSADEIMSRCRPVSRPCSLALLL